ncbi:hypothetical protein E0W68_11660 [Flavobacterium salilacus subsp. salilacus]|uniref:hypothetical protein n=1 Tax=Flavobacterium TaxID=237 RepID=UPI001074C0A9|nr:MULTISPECIES: hypothetical protein [Flavobacterium]KAF2516865.1 hypothetical protein E0W68_11660 [Flavobacterium salilacus subsp. salilacus]MBE1615776.1 hypothetical protein [Flavobacterium sp. SaA2.13]
MKIFSYSLLIIIFQSCATVKSEDEFVKSDYEIAEKTLVCFDKWNNYRLISEPDNYIVDNYLDGFMIDTLDLRNYKFDFKSNRDAKWEYKNFSNPSILAKLKIIDDYSKVKTVYLNDYKDAKRFIKMSRPLYSNDNKYAAVHISSFFNLLTSSQLEGYTLIFFRENNEWTLISCVLTSIS